MITFSTILQGHEATEENAINFAQSFDFSDDQTEDIHLFNTSYFDTVNGVKIYYNYAADYYFFTADYLNQ